MFAMAGVVVLMESLRFTWTCAARPEEIAEKVMLLNVFEGARLQARRIFFDLNNGGAEGPAPSKLLPAGEFSATSRSRGLPKPAQRFLPHSREIDMKSSAILVVQPAKPFPRCPVRAAGLR
jgi:hypothetical protein